MPRPCSTSTCRSFITIASGFSRFRAISWSSTLRGKLTPAGGPLQWRHSNGRKLNSTDVLDALTDVFILRGPPAFIRSDNGPEFVAQKVRDWIAAVGAKTAYIEPGSP